MNLSDNGSVTFNRSSPGESFALWVANRLMYKIKQIEASPTKPDPVDVLKEVGTEVVEEFPDARWNENFRNQFGP